VAIDEFHTILTSLSESGTTVFMVTHDVYGACHVAKRVALLQQGRMVGQFEAGDGLQISAEEVHQTFTQYQSS
jgi:ABC-2 type transport system ATP-binding protein